MTSTKTQIEPEEDIPVEAAPEEDTPLADVKAALSSKYEILENLGKGEICTVYRAIDRRSNVEVALEILPPHLAQNVEYVKRFHREANIASRLNNRNISKIYDEGVHNGVHFVTVEYLDGLDFHTMVMWKGRLDAKEATKILVPAVEALAYAHEKGLIHRDLRSSNLIITDVGRPVLTDFWVDHSSRGAKLAGALEYMSPEEVEGKELTRSSNIYCFGVILYEALTGKVPFSGSNPFEIVGKIISNPPVFPRKIASTIPDWMEEIVMRCLAKNPKDRFSSAAELAAALLRSKAPIIASQPVSQKPPISHNNSKTKTRPPAPGVKKNALPVVGHKPSPPPELSRKDNDKKEVKEKAEAEKEKIEIEKRTAEAQKEKLEIEKRRVEAEKNKVEVEKRMAEAQKEKLEIEKRRVEAEKIKVEFKERRVEVQKEKAEVSPPVKKKIEKPVEEITRPHAQIKPLLRIALPLVIVAAALIIVISNTNLLHHEGQNQTQAANDESKSGRPVATQQKEEGKTIAKNLDIVPNEEAGKNQTNKIEPASPVAKVGAQQAPSSVPISQPSKETKQGEEKTVAMTPSKTPQPTIKVKQPDKVEQRITPVINIQWVFVDSGTFQMGSNSFPSTKPLHTVKVSSFYMSATEITFEQYDKYCEATNAKKPSDNGWGRGKMPVVNVSWNDAVAYCQWVSDQTGKTVHLPTEAEFEFAARGGNKSGGYLYSGTNNPDLVAWYANDSGGKPHEVGTKAPNELGLYDMSGNVWEWCRDWYHQSYDGAPTDGKVWNVEDRFNPYRVLRGGSANGADYCSQVSFRFWLAPFYRDKVIGFRVVKEVK
jgi:serine/threonine-protein kinase PpkA